jgi:hypothetical protein
MQRTTDAGRIEDDTGASAVLATVCHPLMDHAPMDHSNSADVPAAVPLARSPRSPLWRFARAISNPWVSISLLVVVFIHQAVGSAFYTVRQSFEVNEMEWFNGGASLLLWVVICICMITASIVRVPWTWRKVGTHLTHFGVVMMVITCGIYFGYKHEGDALLVRHYIKVESADGACRLLPNPGYRAVFGAGTATVQSIMPKWTILSPAGKSEQAWAVMVEIELPDTPKFTATLIEDRPDLTQYTLAGRQPQSFMPEYPEMVAADGRLHAVTADGKSVLSTEVTKGAKSVEPLTGGERSLEITGVTVDFPLMTDGFQGRSGTMIEWTLKTPAGQQSGSSVVGEPTLTRFQRARVKTPPDARLKTIALEPAPYALAYHKDRSALWVRREEVAERSDPLQPMRSMDAQSVIALPIVGLPRYHERGSFFDSAKPLNLAIGPVNNVEFSVTAFAPYARLTTQWKDVADAPPDPRLELALTVGSKEESRMLPPSPIEALESQPLVWIFCADQTAYDTLLSRLKQRFPETGKKPTTLDENASPRLVFISSPVISTPKSLELWVGIPDAGLQMYPVKIGGEVQVDLYGEKLPIRLKQLLQTPRRVTEPVVVPQEQRTSRMSVGDYESLIQVTATSGGRTTSVWVPYTPYPHLPRDLGNDGALGMYAPRPVTIDVPGAGRFELCYGKEPLPMPGNIWMTGFDVPRRPGSNSPSEFYCHVAYGDVANPQNAVIHMNEPLAWRDTFFFQAGWDPQSQALTVLGVGNRPAGAAMLISAIILACGMALSGGMAALAGRKS